MPACHTSRNRLGTKLPNNFDLDPVTLTYDLDPCDFGPWAILSDTTLKTRSFTYLTLVTLTLTFEFVRDMGS